MDKKTHISKKLLSIALCALLVLVLLPATALADNEPYISDVAVDGLTGGLLSIRVEYVNLSLSKSISVEILNLDETSTGITRTLQNIPSGGTVDEINVSSLIPGTQYRIKVTIEGIANPHSSTVFRYYFTCYIVSYDPNGSAGSMSSYMHAEGSAHTVQPNGFIAPAGYKFDTWNTKQDGTGITYRINDSLTVATEDVILYAQWIPIPPVINSVTVSPKTASVHKGETQQFTATVDTQGSAAPTDVTWSVDSQLSNINANGLLTIDPNETADTLTVKATSDFDRDKTDTAIVKVTDAPPQDIVYHFTTDFGTYTGQAEGLTGIINASISAFGGLEVNGQTLHASNYSTNAGSTIITLHPSYLDTLDNGTYPVRAVFTDGYAEGSFTVNRQSSMVLVTGVALDKTKLTLAVGGSGTLTATVSPENATNKGVKWASSNTSVATVDANGKVKGVKPGTATITVTTDDGGYTATCKVTVTATTNSTQTGDNSNMMLWIITLLSSILIGLCMLVWRKRQQIKENA